MKRYTLTLGATEQARRTGKFVVVCHSHRQVTMFSIMSGWEWYGPLSLGSKTKLYLANDTPENRALYQGKQQQ